MINDLMGNPILTRYVFICVICGERKGTNDHEEAKTWLVNHVKTGEHKVILMDRDSPGPAAWVEIKEPPTNL